MGPLGDAIVTLIEIDQTMQHVFVAPPGMNQEAAAAIRASIMLAFTTDAYRQDAERIPSFVPDRSLTSGPVGNFSPQGRSGRNYSNSLKPISPGIVSISAVPSS